MQPMSRIKAVCVYCGSSNAAVDEVTEQLPADTKAWFEEFALSPGASDDDYNAYNYMILTAMARPESYNVIPAVIHKDGTARVQIVRQEIDPLTHAYLKAMGRRVGVEVSVNTSLNVGSPIAQTPQQAIETLRRMARWSGPHEKPTRSASFR